jgi:Protein of unknown function (DUF3047)
MRNLAFAAVVAFQPAIALASEAVTFDGSWKEQGFLRLFSNDYIQRGRQLDVISDGTVSLLWRPVGQSHRSAESASWAWRVREGVSATDLTIKGGDDRNLSVYFVFLDPDRADAIANGSARRILREDSARALIYVWGGAHELGSILPSPYSPRLRTKVLRTSDAGEHWESFDLARDFRTAFGENPGTLVGLAISADSDDTDGRIVASVADLVLE